MLPVVREAFSNESPVHKTSGRTWRLAQKDAENYCSKAIWKEKEEASIARAIYISLNSEPCRLKLREHRVYTDYDKFN